MKNAPKVIIFLVLSGYFKLFGQVPNDTTFASRSGKKFKLGTGLVVRNDSLHNLTFDPKFNLGTFSVNSTNYRAYGLGTNSPSGLLDIFGDANYSDASSIFKINSNGSISPVISTTNLLSSVGLKLIRSGTERWFIGSPSSSSTENQHLTFTGSGNIGISPTITNPNAKLHIDGKLMVSDTLKANFFKIVGGLGNQYITSDGRYPQHNIVMRFKDTTRLIGGVNRRLVGLNTTLPDALFTIDGSNYSLDEVVRITSPQNANLVFNSNTQVNGLTLEKADTEKWFLGILDASNNFHIKTPSQTYLSINPTNGFIGINKSSPVSLLDIAGNTNSRNFIRFSNDYHAIVRINSDSLGREAGLTLDDQTSERWSIKLDNSDNLIVKNNVLNVFRGFRMDANTGNISIGSNTASNYKLAVNGNIKGAGFRYNMKRVSTASYSLQLEDDYLHFTQATTINIYPNPAFKGKRVIIKCNSGCTVNFNAPLPNSNLTENATYEEINYIDTSTSLPTRYRAFFKGGTISTLSNVIDLRIFCENGYNWLREYYN